MAHPGAEFLNHAAQWTSIVVGTVVVWGTLYRMRKNHMEALRTGVLKEVARVEEDLKGDVREIRKQVAKIGDTVTETRIEVSAIKATVDRCATCQAAGNVPRQ